MTFYEVWPQVKSGSVAKRILEEAPSSKTPNLVYIRWNGSKMEKKTEVGKTIVNWYQSNLNDTDVKSIGWELV